MARSRTGEKPTKLFMFYSLNLIVRLALIVAAVVVAIVAPIQLSVTEGFGLAHGITLIDIIFILVIADGLTKCFPKASIAMGSLKQFSRYHIPTIKLFQFGSADLGQALRDAIMSRSQTVRAFFGQLPKNVAFTWNKTRENALDTIKMLLSDVSFVKSLPIPEKLLTIKDPLRARIKADRLRSIVPVIIFWLIFNGIIAVVLGLFGLLTEPVIIIWMLFYFLFDMICVVLWCPLQLIFMKNRCCTTCPIFNWDAAMTITPLFLMAWNLQNAWFTWPLIALSLVVFVRWEVAFVRHPERFDERTNAALSCVNCHDQLCYIREPLKAKMTMVDIELLGSKLSNAEDLLINALTMANTSAPEPEAKNL